MMNLHLRGTCVLILTAATLVFSALPAQGGGPQPAFCGDGTCDVDEDSCNCPDDCPDDPDSCAACECGGQSSGGCWCDTACHRLGDCCNDICNSCPCCGDGVCQIEEDQCSCLGDCPDPNPLLCDPCECEGSSSDGTCYCDDICVISGDCCENACDECGFCSFCGDGTCSLDEDCSSCPDDCLACGDGFCDFLCEDNCSCPDDCSACGDGFCDILCEDCNNCSADCLCGACCTGPDNCQVTLEVDCPGEYQGDGTFCDANACAPPTGACCIDNQACSEVPNNQCNAGTHLGDGTTCSPDPCPRQCCFSDGSCQRLAEADCTSQGGTPGDPGSDCSVSCPQPTGACVTAGGACTETTQTECFNNSGTFLGPGTSCGACCMSDGSCMETTEADCTGSFSGRYQGDGTDCLTTVCGACCLERAPIIAGIGEGSVCAGLAETECFNYGGVFQGAGTGCEPNPCPQPGACCVAPTAAIAVPGFEDQCVTVLESQCAGTFHGEGVSCDTNPCPHACCFANGSCQELSDEGCTAQGGSPQGSLAHCDQEPALCPDPFGACCGSPGQSCFTAPQITCIGLGGTYQGDGTTCEAPGPCIRGCCFSDGSCQELSGPDCVAQGGTPQGDQAHCDLEPALCPDPLGACCGAAGFDCFTAPAIACTSLGGTYQGDGTTCEAPGPCIRGCCFSDGSCQELSGPDCLAQGGSPQGDQAHCDLEPTLCPDPFGACCGAGDCFTAPELACTGLGGTWQGANTTCDSDPCPLPTGACCFPSGECTGDTTETDCQSQGGAYQGDGSLCGSTVPNCPQPPTGACCFSGSCSELTDSGCADVGGTYQGDGTACDTNTCQPEACCFFSLGGAEVAGISVGDCEPRFSADCVTAGGIPQGAGSACDPNPCVAPCCFLDGSCSILNPDDCFTQGGITQPPTGTCDPNTCPAPACCLSGGGCEHIPVADCVAGGGSPQSPLVTCASDPCAAKGACCYEGKGTGCVEVTADECTSVFEGAFQGDGTDCDPDPCPAANECANQPVGTPCGVDDNNACTSICAAEGVCGIDCDDNNACTIDSCDPGSGCQHGMISCEDFDLCTLDSCNPESGCVHVPVCGACCLDELNGNVAGPIPSGCIDTQAVNCEKGFGGEFLGAGTSCETSTCNPNRVDISTKGSLLIFSDVELAWSVGPAAGVVSTLTTDTVISLTNDYPGEVYVQMYFINGDPELDPLFVGNPPTLAREGEPGCNWVDCQLLLTPDQPIYWSAATGSPAGCQPFDILDPDLGSGPGRPNPDAADGSRVLRGYIVAWAVDQFGAEINWNHLSGKATIVDYAAQTAWEYEPWAFQAHAGEHGSHLHGAGVLELNGVEYDQAFDMLLYDFFAAGSQAFSSDGSTVTLDGELTLHPVTHDLRQEHDEPVTTKAHFDIWNMNERKLSNTRRCLTCWDQALLSTFNAPNSFRLENLQSDKGKARIDGKQADECEENCFRDPLGNPLPVEDLLELLGDLFGEVDVICSQDAALLGVATKILTFSGPAGQRAVAGSPLVGMGFEPAVIRYDIIDPPGTLREEAFQRIGRTVPREHDRLDTSEKELRK